MEKNRIRPVNNRKRLPHELFQAKRSIGDANLIEVQKDSYQWFLEHAI